MAKVITFSRVFPCYHPQKGDFTYFVEQIYNSLYEKSGDWSDAIDPDGKNTSYVIPLNHSIADKKHHTIRAGRRWKVGDKFSPRVWSDKPYKSKQIIIAPDIEIKKIWDIEVSINDYGIKTICVSGKTFAIIGEQIIGNGKLQKLAKNDGLTTIQLHHWFEKPMEGQIICWNEKINY